MSGRAFRTFASPDELADALADDVAAALTARLATDGAASLGVSGGQTPVRFFQRLSGRKLDWAKVTVTLVDDRWVGQSSPRSNAGLVRTHVLTGLAAAARFLPLVTDAPTPEAARAEIEASLSALPLPFAAIVLGMGADGHTASFFPGGDRLAEALAPRSGRLIETMRAEAAGEPRVTLTLPALLNADQVLLHIEGAAKRDVLEAASCPGSALIMPIRAVLNQNQVPLDIFWCP